MLVGPATLVRNWRSRKAERILQRELDVRPTEIMWRRLVRFCAIFAFGWVLALVFHFVIATVQGYVWPHNTFLFKPDYRYSDLTQSWTQGTGRNPYTDNDAKTGGSYFPFAYIVFRAMGRPAPAQLILSYLGVTFAALLCVWAWWLQKQRALWKSDSRWPIVVMLSFFITTCNYPLLFGVDRGNIDPLIMCLVYAAIELVRLRQGTAGGLLLALGAASKGFPVAALLFWVRRRRMGAAVVATLALAALVVLPALSFDGGLAHSWQGYKVNMGEFRNLYVMGPLSSHYSSDGLNAIRILARWQGESIRIYSLVYWYEKATLLYAAIASLLALFVIRETWRELLALALLMLVFPNIANDYKLVFLLPALLEWLTSAARGWRASIFGIATALLFVPKHYYFPHGGEASISCIINPLLILLMSFVLWPTSDEIVRLLMSLEDVQKRFRLLGDRLGRRATAPTEVLCATETSESLVSATRLKRNPVDESVGSAIVEQ